jgi:CIC family chloride channel protein
MANPPHNSRWRGFNHLESALRWVGLNDYTLLLLLAGVCGLVAGLGVVGFRLAYEQITHWAIGGGHEVLEALTHQPAWRVLLVPTLGGLVVGLVVRFMPQGESGEHGVARVIYAVALGNGRVPLLGTIRSFLTNAVSIGVGASVGPEGPVIELGAGLGSTLGQKLRLSPERVRTLVGCGAAAGLAAAFNAPIAGAIFALEVVMRDFAVVTFSPIIVAAVLGTVVSRSLLGDAPAFAVPAYELFSPWELPLYLLLGGLAGALGVLFTRLNHAAESWRSHIPLPLATHPMLGGLLLGGAFLAGLPHLFGVGYEPISELLAGDMHWKLMLVLVGAKLVATNLSLGTGFTGGIFAPTLLMGGALGGLIGQFAARLFPAHTSPHGAYSLVGMAALLAAVTHAPMTSILIVFELTGGYEIILPLMTACISAVAIAQRLMPESIFTLGMARRGIELNFGRESAILRDFYAEDLMHADAPRLLLTASTEEMVDRFLDQSNDRYYVVDGAGILCGVLDLHDMKEMIHTQGLGGVVIAADLMHPAKRVVERRDNLEDTILALAAAATDELPVVTHGDTRELLGTISHRDILELYNREILHRDVLGIKLVHRDTRGTDFVDLPEQYRVELIPVSAAMAGHSLAELDLRGRFSVHVLAIKRPGRRSAGENELPDPRSILASRDRLIVVGRDEDVDALQNIMSKSET